MFSREGWAVAAAASARGVASVWQAVAAWAAAVSDAEVAVREAAKQEVEEKAEAEAAGRPWVAGFLAGVSNVASQGPAGAEAGGGAGEERGGGGGSGGGGFGGGGGMEAATAGPGPRAVSAAACPRGWRVWWSRPDRGQWFWTAGYGCRRRPTFGPTWSRCARNKTFAPRTNVCCGSSTSPCSRERHTSTG